jgi:hypothetical protein
MQAVAERNAGLVSHMTDLSRGLDGQARGRDSTVATFQA